MALTIAVLSNFVKVSKGRSSSRSSQSLLLSRLSISMHYTLKHVHLKSHTKVRTIRRETNTFQLKYVHIGGLLEAHIYLP